MEKSLLCFSQLSVSKIKKTPQHLLLRKIPTMKQHCKLNMTFRRYVVFTSISMGVMLTTPLHAQTTPLTPPSNDIMVASLYADSPIADPNPDYPINPEIAKLLSSKYQDVLKEMHSERKKVLEYVYLQILQDNGETTTFTINGKQKTMSTSQSMQAFMGNLCYLLYNLDKKETDALDLYENLISQIHRGQSYGLVVHDDVMHLLYGLRIYAEQVDKTRAGWFKRPGKYDEEIAEIKKRIALLAEEGKRIAEEGKRIDEEIKRVGEETKKIRAQREVLRIVIQGLEAMKQF